VVNYLSGTSFNLDGTKFPAFLRVSGYLTDAEKLGASRISVFFSSGAGF